MNIELDFTPEEWKMMALEFYGYRFKEISNFRYLDSAMLSIDEFITHAKYAGDIFEYYWENDGNVCFNFINKRLYGDILKKRKNYTGRFWKFFRSLHDSYYRDQRCSRKYYLPVSKRLNKDQRLWFEWWYYKTFYCLKNKDVG